MGDTKFTLIELHLDDTQFGLRSVADAVLGRSGAAADEDAGGTAGRTDESEAAPAASDEESGGPGALGVVVGLVALVAVAVAVRRFRGESEEEELEPVEEPDVVVN